MCKSDTKLKSKCNRTFHTNFQTTLNVQKAIRNIQRKQKNPKALDKYFGFQDNNNTYFLVLKVFLV